MQFIGVSGDHFPPASRGKGKGRGRGSATGRG